MNVCVSLKYFSMKRMTSKDRSGIIQNNNNKDIWLDIFLTGFNNSHHVFTVTLSGILWIAINISQKHVLFEPLRLKCTIPGFWKQSGMSDCVYWYWWARSF